MRCPGRRIRFWREADGRAEGRPRRCGRNGPSCWEERRRSLYYDLDSKLVTDERRRTVLRKELGIAEHPQVNGQRAYWDARWDPSEPDTPVVNIRIDFGDRHSAPIPDEATMRAAMADRAMALYEDLSPRTPVHSVSVYYSHEAQEDEHGGSLWHSITVELPEGMPLTREMVLSGNLESR